jgi:septal ring-binding cell division protein DamX
MDLAGDRFVIELAHASRQSELAAARGAVHVPRGDLYELHFRQNGADAWLLLWGSFDSIEAARAARSELAQSTSAAVGWPRRVAPLQAEARRVSP